MSFQHMSVMGDRLHYHTGREIDSETEKLLEQTSEDEHKTQRTQDGTDTVSQGDGPPVGSTTAPEYDSTCTSVQAAKQKDGNTLSFLRNFYRRPSDGKVERVTPFAVVLLIVLLAVYVLNQADRLVLPVVIPNGLRCNVGKDECAGPNTTNDTSTGNDTIQNGTGTNEDCIQFNDDQQGLLTGPAFTVIYVLAGLPLARLADTRSRPLVLLLGLTFWSVMVLLTGFTKAFWELLVLRIFLGIGEASCNPVAYSLLADIFPVQHRAFAFSVYHYGVYLGEAAVFFSPHYIVLEAL
jgi:hypothetical protein